MTRLYVFVGILGALCGSGFAQSKDQAAGGAEQVIIRIERELLAATLKGDASVSERYLAETYAFTGPDGSVENKAQAVNDLKSGDLKLKAASIEGSKVQVYGDTAVVTYGSHDKGTYKGKDISGNSRWTDVFVRSNGRWQLVASHGSMVSK